MASNVRALRGLIRELRHRAPQQKAKDTVAVPYVLSQYRKFQVTGELLCRQRDQAKSLADAYRVYLESSRKYLELYQHFHGRGERSVADTAKLVGFKLPHDPQK